MKATLTIKAPARAAAPRAGAVRAAGARKTKPKSEAARTVARIREIALSVGGFDDVELPERFKNRTPY